MLSRRTRKKMSKKYFDEKYLNNETISATVRLLDKAESGVEIRHIICEFLRSVGVATDLQFEMEAVLRAYERAYWMCSRLEEKS
jgi:hypothetical protein